MGPLQYPRHHGTDNQKAGETMKIVIAGSCKHAPYDILIVPNPLDPDLYVKHHERAFKEACKVFHPKIDEADEVWVYAPNGIGKHTQHDIDYAHKQGKTVRVLVTLHPRTNDDRIQVLNIYARTFKAIQRYMLLRGNKHLAVVCKDMAQVCADLADTLEVMDP